MVHSRPKYNALFAVGFFLIILLAVAIWFLIGLITNPDDYFIWKLVLIPILLVIGIMVATKSYFSALSVTLGKEKITYQYLLGSKKTVKTSAIITWREEVIKSKGSTYRSLSIEIEDGKKLRLSNHENGNYEKVLNYMKKKVRLPD